MFHFLLALIPFNPVSESEEVKAALDKEIPGHVWNVKEIGDGNINYIYLAEDGKKKVLVKKALDYARINPEAFPLPIERLSFEHKAYELYQKACPERIPEIYFFDPVHGMLAMEYLYPHVILRKGLLAGKKYPLLANHLGEFLGRSLYLTSRYHLPQEEWRKNAAFFQKNTAMRDIIESLNFTQPFHGSELNRWTSPELDGLVQEIQTDSAIRQKVDALKAKFLTDPETLCHGDLHTGSILATGIDTRVFDTEFATYGPISFDIGMLLANFAMASLSSLAHDLDSYWICSQMRKTWDVFEETFRELWDCPSVSVDDKLSEVWRETLQLMGVEIVRRTIGIAHNADFETIGERETKVLVERRALRLAMRLILGADESFPTPALLERQVHAMSVHLP